MAKFVSAEIDDPGPIAVELWQAVDGQIIGNVRRRRDGVRYSNVSPDMPASSAIHLAELEADALGCNVLVIDPRALWAGHWGELLPPGR